MKDLRKKVNVFAVNDTITIKRLNNKQGTTRVSVFKADFAPGMTAYLTTI